MAIQFYLLQPLYNSKIVPKLSKCPLFRGFTVFTIVDGIEFKTVKPTQETTYVLLVVALLTIG